MIKKIKERVGNVITLANQADGLIQAYENETLKVAYVASDKGLFIKYLEVKDSYRRQGKATKFLLDICQVCDNHGLICSIIMPLDVQEYFTDFLEYIGFRFYEKYPMSVVFVRAPEKVESVKPG